jgi:oligopeptide/dipeptide ABC transporter ATP-binding protein
MSLPPPILEIANLSVRYPGQCAAGGALRGIDMTLRPGEVLGVVGESGSGKTTLIGAVMRLLSGGAVICGGEIRFAGRDLVPLPESEMRTLRGGGMALVAQNPMAAFNPVLPLGRQLMDVQYRDDIPAAEKRARILAMLRRVGIADPEAQLGRYATQFSGGMLQRFAIAAALLTRPRLLIADEPTTALDMTTECQVLTLLRELCDEMGCAILFVSHHLGSVARLCDQVCVLYAGEVVECGSVHDIFTRPAHPYTRRLLECDPSAHEGRAARLPTIGGGVPDPAALPEGCVFAPRCALALADCLAGRPALRRVGMGHVAACHRMHHEQFA